MKKCMNPGCNKEANIKIGNKYTENVCVCGDCHQFITMISDQSILRYLEDLIDDGVLLKRLVKNDLNPYGDYEIIKRKRNPDRASK